MFGWVFVDEGNLLWDHTPEDLSGPEQGRGAVGLGKEEWEAGTGLARNRRTRALSLPACLPAWKLLGAPAAEFILGTFYHDSQGAICWANGS